MTVADVTDEQLVKGFIHTYGMTRSAAERQTAIARGDFPRDVAGLPPAEPLGKPA